MEMVVVSILARLVPRHAFDTDIRIVEEYLINLSRREKSPYQPLRRGTVIIGASVIHRPRLTAQSHRTNIKVWKAWPIYKVSTAPYPDYSECLLSAGRP